MTRPEISSIPAAGLGHQVLSIRVDKANPLPVYVQIADEVRRILRAGSAPPSTELPPERLLCTAYGVSRATLRQAFGVLEREGLIESRRGRGTFISLRRPERRQERLCTFTDESRAQVGSAMLLSFRADEPSPAAREFFGPETGPVYHIERLRLMDTRPISLESVQVPQSLCPNLDRFDLVHDSVYRILEEEYAISPAGWLEEISAARPNHKQKRLLQAPPSSAVLVVCRKTLAANDVRAAFATTVYRGDIYTAAFRSVALNSGEKGR